MMGLAINSFEKQASDDLLYLICNVNNNNNMWTYIAHVSTN